MSHRVVGTERDRYVDAVRESVERIAGERPPSCPWRALTRPVVVAVMRLHAACTGAMGTTPALVLPLDPPWVYWQGLLVYADALARVRSDAERARAQDAERRRGG